MAAAAAFGHPLTQDRRWYRVQNGLSNLCTRGIEPWWIIQKTPELIKLESVKLAAQTASRPPDEPHHLPKALADVLREIVAEFRHEPDGIVLRIMLGLDRVYKDLEGVEHPLLELGAEDRQKLAGQEFRGNRAAAVGGHTIRLNHMPSAVNRLAVELLYRDVDLVGSWLKVWNAPRKLTTHAPGSTAPAAGDYHSCDAHGFPTDDLVALERGQEFPPPAPDTLNAAWVSAAEVAA